MNKRIENELRTKVPNIRRFLKSNYQMSLEDKDIFDALLLFVDKKVDELVEDFDQIITQPHLSEHQDFLSLLPRGSIFTGNREFSYDKLRAVIVFFATVLGARRLSKTRANKLAFYSDFYNFRLTGRSISGSSYIHLPHGPVIADYEDLLAKMDENGFLNIEDSDGGSFISSTDGAWRDILSEEEKETCRLVLEKFGKLNAAEISDQSHSETAWKNTRTGETISYGYAQFFD